MTRTTDQTRYGWKFLTPWGTTEAHYTEYALPAPGEKCGAWIHHPEPAEADGEACGPGRYHVMKRLDARFGPRNWWAWFVEGRGVVGEDDLKFAATSIRLRRVRPAVLHRMIRLGWLRGATLGGATLSGADLSGATLTDADLRHATLTDADLSGATLYGATLYGADLGDADLRHAIGLDDPAQ